MHPSFLFSKNEDQRVADRRSGGLAYAYSVSSQFQTAKIDKRVETADLGYAILNKINSCQLGYEL